MGHWKNANINLGVITAGKAKKVVFEALPDIPEITQITPYCECTSATFDKEKKELTIIYNNSKISNQVQGPQSVTKRIDVTYNTGLTEVLTIRATRTR